MPQEGIDWKPKDQILSLEEIFRVASVFTGMGINKIRLTGGEPLLRRNLEWLAEQLASLPRLRSLAMTTNAVLLEKRAKDIRQAGVTALNISLDSLRAERFRQITRRDDHSAVMRGIERALEAGFHSLKLNVVVIRGFNEDEIVDFVDFVRDKPVNVRFIEFMPFKDTGWTSAGVFPYADMVAAVREKYELSPLDMEPSAVAKDYALPGFRGTVSFITSMTESFCSSCNRLRLTADGSVKSCLFHPAEINLRDELRAGISNQALAALIRSAVLLKPPEHPPMDAIAAGENRSMIEIGG